MSTFAKVFVCATFGMLALATATRADTVSDQIASADAAAGRTLSGGEACTRCHDETEAKPVLLSIRRVMA
jgi:cytochrome c553